MSRLKGVQVGYGPPPKPGSMLIAKAYKRPGDKPKQPRRR